MGSWINGVKDNMIGIVDTVVGFSHGKPVEVGVVAYRDFPWLGGSKMKNADHKVIPYSTNI